MFYALLYQGAMISKHDTADEALAARHVKIAELRTAFMSQTGEEHEAAVEEVNEAVTGFQRRTFELPDLVTIFYSKKIRIHLREKTEALLAGVTSASNISAAVQAGVRSAINSSPFPLDYNQITGEELPVELIVDIDDDDVE